MSARNRGVELLQRRRPLLGSLGEQLVVELLGGPVAARHVGQDPSPDLLEGLEVLDRVVGEVVPLLVDLPGDAGLLEPFRVRRPVVAGVRVVVGRVGDRAVRRTGLVADRTGPQVVAVRVGRAVDRAVVGVADREGLGQLVLQRDVAALVVGHRGGGLGRHPVVVPAVAPGLGRVGETVRECAQVLDVARVAPLGGGRLAHRERQHLAAGGGRLLEHGLAVAQPQRPAVAVPADAAQRAVVVVEGTVLLHQHDHVLDRLQAALAQRLRHRGVQGRREQRQGCSTSGGPQYETAGNLRHGCRLAPQNRPG
jgi:hypothetical protein